MKYRKILIVGDSGRGKSTLAKKLQEKIGVKHFELDDIYWEKKYTVPRDKEEQNKMVLDILNSNDMWIIDSANRRMSSLCFDSADIIIYLRYKNLLEQIINVWKRASTRRDKDERFIDTFKLTIHLIKKRYKLGSQKNRESLSETVKPFENKVLELYSFEDIDKFLEEL